MTENTITVILPPLLGRGKDPTYEQDALALAAYLQPIILSWALRRPEKLSAEAVGAGIYAALWGLSESASPENREAMRNACLATLLQNNPTTANLLSVDSSFPPN
jgi:hypothetical protein